MATIVAVETEDGAVLAGDRLRVEDGTVRSRDARHVFDFGGVGAAAVGDGGAVDEFRRELESEVQSYDTERDEPMSVGRLATVASNLAPEGIEAIVAARDDDGRARVRGIAASGGIVTDDRFAFGSGAQFALGALEGRELDDLDAEEAAREAIETAADRDTATGEAVDVYRLESGSESV